MRSVGLVVRIGVGSLCARQRVAQVVVQLVFKVVARVVVGVVARMLPGLLPREKICMRSLASHCGFGWGGRFARGTVVFYYCRGCC